MKKQQQATFLVQTICSSVYKSCLFRSAVKLFLRITSKSKIGQVNPPNKENHVSFYYHNSASPLTGYWAGVSRCFKGYPVIVEAQKQVINSTFSQTQLIIVFVLLLATRPMVEVEQTRCCVLPTCNGKPHKRGYKLFIKQHVPFTNCFDRPFFLKGWTNCFAQNLRPSTSRLPRMKHKDDLYPLLCCFPLQVGKTQCASKHKRLLGCKLTIPTNLNSALHKIGTYCLNLSFRTKQVDQDRIHP